MALFSVLPSACGSSPSPEKSSNQLVEAGLSAEKAGNVDKAFSDYEAAVTKDPRNKYAHYDLGYVYQIRGDAPQAAVQYAQTLY
ncbi:MAG: tetratricopeptide repeat protein, partial [Acidimicrobiales bacterium]